MSSQRKSFLEQRNESAEGQLTAAWYRTMRPATTDGCWVRGTELDSVGDLHEEIDKVKLVAEREREKTGCYPDAYVFHFFKEKGLKR